MLGLRQLSSVEQFHEQGHGATDSAVTSLIAPDRSRILDTQPNSERGHGKTGSLADSFEFGSDHLPDPGGIVLHDHLLDDAVGHSADCLSAIFGVLPCLPVGDGGNGYPSGLCSGFGLLRGFDLLPGPIDASGFGILHFQSPVWRGSAHCCASLVGPMVLLMQAQSHSVRRKFPTQGTSHE